VQKLRGPPADSLSLRLDAYGKDRTAYNGVAEEANKFAAMGQQASIIAAVDSLHTQQETVKGKIDAFLKYNDEFGRRLLFARSIEKIQDDVDYIYATVKKYATQVQTQKVQREMRDEQKQLDQEIEKLKGQMKELEKKEEKDEGREEEEKEDAEE
jgi:hypothetical protein